LIASKAGRDGSLSIHQDADVSVARLAKSGELEYGFGAGRAGWVQLIEGELAVNGELLTAGDAVAISEEKLVRLKSGDGAHFLFFDLN
jgi:redox-sensitive bicupin YhaK (pirin superfamily)